MRAIVVALLLCAGLVPLEAATQKNVHHAKVKKSKVNGPKAPKHKAHPKAN